MTTTNRMTEQDLQRFLRPGTWTYAKSMPDNPHEYIIRGRHVGTVDDWAAALKALEEFGQPMRFQGYDYLVFRFGAYRYWGTGHIINRALENTRHDELADRWDTLWNDEASQARCSAIQERLRGVNFQIGTTLDIGARTGLAARLLNITDQHYVGLDPSEQMLRQLKLRHPTHTTVQKSLEAFQTIKQFDRVVSLHGALNYSMPRFLGKPAELVRPGGFYFLMTFAPDYIRTAANSNAPIGQPFETDIPEMRRLYGQPEKLGESFLVWTNILRR